MSAFYWNIWFSYQFYNSGILVGWKRSMQSISITAKSRLRVHCTLFMRKEVKLRKKIVVMLPEIFFCTHTHL